MIIRLPYPPSVNNYWRHITRGKLSGRVLISKAGRKYQQDVAVRVLQQRAGRLLDGRLAVGIVLCPPDRRVRDIDNPVKPVLDALTKAGVWLDDRQIDQLVVIRGKPCEGGLAQVEVNHIREFQVASLLAELPASNTIH